LLEENAMSKKKKPQLTFIDKVKETLRPRTLIETLEKELEEAQREFNKAMQDWQEHRRSKSVPCNEMRGSYCELCYLARIHIAMLQSDIKRREAGLKQARREN